MHMQCVAITVEAVHRLPLILPSMAIYAGSSLETFKPSVIDSPFASLTQYLPLDPALRLIKVNCERLW